MADLIGQQLGQYEIIAHIGAGGMATVYRARQLNIRREVAIKVIKSDLTTAPAFNRRFEREAETIAALSHLHILKLFDYGEQDGILYLVMELLSGGSLSELIVRERPLALDKIIRILEQVGSALDYAHQKGIVHRDLKPQNVLFDEAGNAFLSDFGIAKLVSGVTSLTQSGTAMGTPAYMSPEQWRGKDIDSRADIYAFGIMLFEMLTGQLPYLSDTPYGLMHQHVYNPPPSALVLRIDLPSGIDSVIAGALAKEPEQRYQTADAVVTAFKTALNSPSAPPSITLSAQPVMPSGQQTMITPPPAVSTRPTGRGNRFNWILGAIALLLVIVLGGILIGGLGSSSSVTSTLSLTVVGLAAPAGTPTASPTAITSVVASIVARDTATSSPIPSQPSTATIAHTPTGTATLAPTATFTYTPPTTFTPVPTNTTIPLPPTVAFTNTPVPPNFTASGTCTQGIAVFAVANTGGTPGTASWVIKDNFGHAQSGSTTLNVGQTTTLTGTGMVGTVTLTLTGTDINVTANADCPIIPTATLTPSNTPVPPTPTPLPTFTPSIAPTIPPVPTITTNKQWSPQIQAFDSVEMVLVPPGCFKMGSTNGYDDEKPITPICFDKPFWIDKTEVTQAQFKHFNGQAGSKSAFTGDNLPVESITWFEARDFCVKRGAHLPTEAEWEYAARGPDNLIYPWGNTLDTSKIVFNHQDNGSTVKVGSIPGGTSWVGALDMIGNVWEWTSSLHSPYPYNASDGRESKDDRTSERVMRGGSWYDNETNILRASNRGWYIPTTRLSYLGMRCAHS